MDQPQIATAQLIMKKGSASDVEKEAAEVIEKELENIQAFSMELVAGKCPVC
ncbi:MAG: methionine adenosyltransferase [Methanosarcina sp.]|nr:methionine adenosyltransferase [Methanosarcina sp.]